MSRSSNSWFPWNGASPPKEESSTAQITTSTISQKQELATTELPAEKDITKTKTLKNKASVTSLSSMSAGSWLGWSSKVVEQPTSSSVAGLTRNGMSSNLKVSSVTHNSVSKHIDEEDDDFSSDDNGDEVEENIKSKSRKKLWSFWNSLEDPSTNKRDIATANTILTSTTEFSSAEALPISETEEANESEDAVLYKPHNSASQFNKINTHKNENIYENIIVPPWETCLKLRDNSFNSSTSQQTSDADRAHSSFRIKNWRGYLSYLSSRFGFGSPNVSSDQDTEFRDPCEHIYHLYGRALQILPPAKRSCLPNFGFYYDQRRGSSSTTTSTRNEDNDPIVTLANDNEAGFAINASSSDTADNVAVYSQPLGPLKKIERILIIGVHGFFPTRMIRPLIGAPKGTSLKFANEAEKAIIRYCLENGLIKSKESTVSIQKIALEREGKIFDRVAFFMDILTKWERELNEADFVFIAAHSQGCVVSIILLAQLIKRGIIKNPISKRISILGMAGVNNGPFYGTDKSLFMKAYSAIEHESLLELFELNKFDSPQSVAYKEAMQILITTNVKVCLIGSINDLLVPLYSALASHVFHPNIYRACYIDRSSNTPRFIARLVSICCQLQNMGFFDSNVIRELSSSLPGPITGGGHSKIYNDGKVYDLGVKFALDTDDLVIPNINGDPRNLLATPAQNQLYTKEYNVGKLGTNPFILPWCLRGLILSVEKNWPASGTTIKSGHEQIRELYELFDEWKPSSKLLRDLKFRLSGIRNSKL